MQTSSDGGDSEQLADPDRPGHHQDGGHKRRLDRTTAVLRAVLSHLEQQMPAGTEGRREAAAAGRTDSPVRALRLSSKALRDDVDAYVDTLQVRLKTMLLHKGSRWMERSAPAVGKR